MVRRGLTHPPGPLRLGNHHTEGVLSCSLGCLEWCRMSRRLIGSRRGVRQRRLRPAGSFSGSRQRLHQQSVLHDRRDLERHRGGPDDLYPSRTWTPRLQLPGGVGLFHRQLTLTDKKPTPMASASRRGRSYPPSALRPHCTQCPPIAPNGRKALNDGVLGPDSIFGNRSRSSLHRAALHAPP